MGNATARLGFKVLSRDKETLRRLAELEGEAMAVVVRRLIRQEAQRCGLSSIASHRDGESRQKAEPD